MEGDSWVRHCELCAQKVYNLSALTRAEAERLLSRSEGRICTKFYRRPDGTILTQPCPSSIRRAWGSALKLVAAIGFAIPAFAHDSIWCVPSSARFERKSYEGNKSLLSGTVADQTGVRLPGYDRSDLLAVVSVTRLRSDETHNVKVDDKGRFSIELVPGQYELRVEAPGFKSYLKKSLRLPSSTAVSAAVTLAVGSMGGNA